jgi:carbonic anhydrase
LGLIPGEVVMKKLCVSILALLFVVSQGFAAEEAPAGSPDSDQALQKVKQGNDRFVSGRRLLPNQGAARLRDTAARGQHPYVTILSCSDSRVPLEHLFDAGFGDLFVVRVAGNVADDDEIGTVEYGVGHLHTPLLLVLGHTKCGAVTAVAKGDQVHGKIPVLVDNIVPAVKKARVKCGSDVTPAMVKCAIEQNVWQSVEDIMVGSHEVRSLVKEGKLKVVGALYDIETGKVDWMGEHPGQAALISSPHGGVPVIAHAAGVAFLSSCAAGLVFFLLFVNRKTRFSSLKIRGRLVAAMVCAALTALAGSLALTLFAWITHMKLGTVDMAASMAGPLVAATVFGLLSVRSIIGSFKTVIDALKAGKGDEA